MSTDWDKLYSSRKRVYSTNEALIQDALAALRPNARVLELGAGQGQNAAIVAEAGFDILATDISAVAVEQIKELAREKGLPNLHAAIRDQREPITESYDMIMSIRSLHATKRTVGAKTIHDIQDHTNPGGLNLLVLLTTHGDFFKIESQKNLFYIVPDEIRDLYRDWEILSYSLRTFQAVFTLPNGLPTFNENLSLLARKPA